MLGNVLVPGDIKILEHWLQMDSLDLDSLSVLLENRIYLRNFVIAHLEVLLSCERCIFDSYWSNSGLWNLLDTIGCKSRINISAELNVIEHLLWVVGLVLFTKRFKLFESQVEVQHREN